MSKSYAPTEDEMQKLIALMGDMARMSGDLGSLELCRRAKAGDPAARSEIWRIWEESIEEEAARRKARAN